MMKTIQWEQLIISILISLGVGNLAGVITADSMEQYQMINKPPFSPPGIVFPIVWTILFILMGIAAYLVYVSDDNHKRKALTLYGIQLIVNLFWSIIFFGLQAYFFAFVWLILLWILVFFTMKAFYGIDKRAGWLLLPYLLWITFAGYLNLAIVLI